MIRKRLEHLNKLVKRPRVENEQIDDSAIQNVEREEIFDVENVDPNEENERNGETILLEFQHGSTNKGGLCLWNEGFRYIRNKATRWKCSNKDCHAAATVTIHQPDGVSWGKIISKPHNHAPEPQRQDAEERRAHMKRKIGTQPTLKPSKIMNEARSTASDEEFVAMGSDHALRLMTLSYWTFYAITGDGEWMARSNPRQNPSLNVVVAAYINIYKMAICMHALLPSKSKNHYVEALNALKMAIHPVTPHRISSDFEMSMISATREVYPLALLNGCMFHQSQALFKKWCNLGLKNNLNDQFFREAFRKVLSLPMLPIDQVRRAFAIIVDSAPNGMEEFLLCFAEVYIGFTEVELQLGAIAFQAGTVIREQSTILSDTSANQRTPPLIFGQPSPRPSTPTMSTTIESIVQRWQIPIPIVRRPRFPLEFWNLHDQAMNALARTNNSMEASHLQFMKGLNHHPSMSNFILALHEDADKQVVIVSSVAHFPQKRHQRYALQEQHVMATLMNVSYETDADLCDLMSLLGLQMQGYVSGLRVKAADLEVSGPSFLSTDESAEEEITEEFMNEPFDQFEDPLLNL